MLDVALTPLAKRALQALSAEFVEPGQLPWSDLRAHLEVSDQVLARVVNCLEADGLVVQEGWDGAKHALVRLTQPGREICGCRGWRSAVPS